MSPNQTLRRDLQGLAADLKWSAVELMQIAERLRKSGNENDAHALARINLVMHAGEERLNELGDRVESGMLVARDGG